MTARIDLGFLPICAAALCLAFMVGGFSTTSATRYFPESLSNEQLSCSGRKAPLLSEIRRDWYSRQLGAAGEPSLFQMSTKAPPLSTSYRFTWLRSFHNPVTVRIDLGRDGRFLMTAKRLSGAGGYGPGTVSNQIIRPLNSDEQKKIVALIKRTDVLHQPPVDCTLGTDGAEWIIEANENGAYHFINRWTMDGGPVHEVGLAFLALTGWNLDPIY